MRVDESHGINRGALYPSSLVCGQTPTQVTRVLKPSQITVTITWEYSRAFYIYFIIETMERCCELAETEIISPSIRVHGLIMCEIPDALVTKRPIPRCLATQPASAYPPTSQFIMYMYVRRRICTIFVSVLWTFWKPCPPLDLRIPLIYCILHNVLSHNSCYPEE